MDTVDQATRSKIMSKVGHINTGPEMKLRRALHRLGLRYRLHDRTLPGSPDIVFPRFKAVLFVHGCFWHRHGCKGTTTPKSNTVFWRKKFQENQKRDRQSLNALQDNDWRVVVVWECALRGRDANLVKVAELVHEWLSTNEKQKEIPINKGVKSKIRRVSRE